uniref:HSFtype DNAbinding protein putative n=1 Tax=Albugo laibachii Nc14 TaxID=890382 RepID=F0WH05_9STRA|nr:HSFtype DNAbinding protein putative [Albugo laibachii Nc14]|eukprot:CCA20520.1 HSFtype DNAbinding protein putative [Albugo laibachii Nc14]
MNPSTLNPNDSLDLTHDHVSKIDPGLAPFLKSLRIILQNESQDIMRWTADGLAFEILDMGLMTERILPKYFKHSKYTSFQRQLNYFNFRKWTKSKATRCTFSNKFFVRDDPELAWCITRKKTVPVNTRTERKAGMKVTKEPSRVFLSFDAYRAQKKSKWSIYEHDASRSPVPIPLRTFSIAPRSFGKKNVDTFPESSNSVSSLFQGYEHFCGVNCTHHDEPYLMGQYTKFGQQHVEGVRYQPIEPIADPLDWVDTFLPSLDVHFCDKNADKLISNNRMLMA